MFTRDITHVTSLNNVSHKHNIHFYRLHLRKHCTIVEIWIAAVTRISLLSIQSGTTWMQNIVYTLVTKGKRELDHISYYAPFYEADRSWSSNGKVAEPSNKAVGYRIQNIQCPCAFDDTQKWHKDETHLRREKSKDVVCSFFHHLLLNILMTEVSDPLRVSIKWIQGNIAFGKWTSHVEQWLEYCNSEHSNVVVSFKIWKNLTREM